MNVLIGIELPDSTVMYSEVTYDHRLSVIDWYKSFFNTTINAKELVEKYSPVLYNNSVEEYIESNQDLYDMIFLYVGEDWEQVAFKF